MAAVHMMDKMDGNFVNYSILLQEYAAHCENMYSNSSTMVEEIMGTCNQVVTDEHLNLMASDVIPAFR